MTKKNVFSPGADNARAFRDCLGCFGTGVCVITTATDLGPLAVTANSFSAVSLDPPLVLWSIATTSKRHAAFVDAKHTSIHILRADQKQVALSFARDGFNFDQAPLDQREGHAPWLAQSLVRMDCTSDSNHLAGDHTILVSRVDNVEQSQGDPLLFVQGKYLPSFPA